ncbi:MAG TPA: carboxypeptidase regulatory-like domain-containing protein [Terriglobia bacterium]|nr:carboxypeptidase regulatory-like domain-containing protein [Terriglobia bacterium]
MISLARRLGIVLLVACSVAWSAYGPADGTISGTVRNSTGAPFQGAFVRARNVKTKTTVNVLSDKQGRFRVQNLPPGDYEIRGTAIGYKDDVRSGVKVTGGQPQSLDFALQKGTVRWSDLNTYQGRRLLPKTGNHDLSYQDKFFTSCLQSCHSFQKTMTSVARDENGWRQKVKYMSEAIMGGEGGGLSNQDVEDFTSYLTFAFGPSSPKPPSPEEMPEYKALVRSFSDEAMKIEYVEYDFAGAKGLGPWSAVEDKDGMIWSPYYGRGNEVVRLNPNTGDLTRFPLPFAKTAGIHSAIPSPDGTVWFTEAALSRIGQLNPVTGKITEYSNLFPDGQPAGAHTVRVDQNGKVWISGGVTISSFEPRTQEFTHYGTAGTYGNVVGPNGEQWFTVFREGDSPIVRVKNGSVSKFSPPTKGKPQRLQVDSDGIVWFSERRGGKIGRFDPKTETFKEFQLPGPEPSPYALGIDRNHMIWYASHEQDTLGRLNPRTGEVTEYPFPHSEISMREFFLDSQGRLWYASPANDKIGYFIPPSGN